MRTLLVTLRLMMTCKLILIWITRWTKIKNSTLTTISTLTKYLTSPISLLNQPKPFSKKKKRLLSFCSTKMKWTWTWVSQWTRNCLLLTNCTSATPRQVSSTNPLPTARADAWLPTPSSPLSPQMWLKSKVTIPTPLKTSNLSPTPK